MLWSDSIMQLTDLVTLYNSKPLVGSYVFLPLFYTWAWLTVWMWEVFGVNAILFFIVIIFRLQNGWWPLMTVTFTEISALNQSKCGCKQLLHLFSTVTQLFNHLPRSSFKTWNRLIIITQTSAHWRFFFLVYVWLCTFTSHLSKPPQGMIIQ